MVCLLETSSDSFLGIRRKVKFCGSKSWKEICYIIQCHDDVKSHALLQKTESQQAVTKNVLSLWSVGSQYYIIHTWKSVPWALEVWCRLLISLESAAQILNSFSREYSWFWHHGKQNIVFAVLFIKKPWHWVKSSPSLSWETKMMRRRNTRNPK